MGGKIKLNLCSFPDVHSKFNPQQSSTYSANGQTVYIPYGAGSLYGVFGYDTVSVSVYTANSVITIQMHIRI